MTEQKSIWVFIEQTDGRIADVSLELIGKARELADQLGYEVVGLLCGHDVDELAQDVIRHGADRVLAGRPPGARALPHAPLRPGRDHRGPPPPAGDLPLRRHAQRPRPRAARRQRPALRPDRRLHRPADRRLRRQARGPDVQGPALPDPARLRRQPHRHDRQPEHAGPRWPRSARASCACRPPTRAGPASSSR